jgi:glycosyltransferase involved in cell wall biosynthesis
MKLLFILPLPPPVHGSSVVSKAIKDSELINGAFDCRFINSSYSRDMGEIGGMSFKKLWISIFIFFETLKALIIFRPGLCYMAPTAKGIGFYKDLPVIALLKLFGRKIVLHLHNKGVALYQGRWLDDKLYRFAFRNTKLILLSERLYGDVKRYVDKNDVYICPNGISGQLIQKHYRTDGVAKLLFLSNMMAAKGVYDLLDACALLKGRDLDFRCDFVGKWADIIERDFRAAIEKKNLSNCVFAHGAKYGNEKTYFFEQADIFVFPTYYHNESFSLVLLEAMQFGLSIISTNEGGIPDIVDNEKNGYIVEKQHPQALAVRIEKLIQNPALRESMGRAGQEKFRQNYTLDIFINRMCWILRQCF